jgi:hypothetical protein
MKQRAVGGVEQREKLTCRKGQAEQEEKQGSAGRSVVQGGARQGGTAGGERRWHQGPRCSEMSRLGSPR